ncbi:Hsp20/alpha crystallin family protein [Desulfoplanes formicivorans]|uniref:SHSP domain-containing protein n=1 Tax=Desulfoplanes formicivorans TaxID=1592317 RepID=A0A194AHZ7_9BACT|nr:Hsp20/alpha crystallin family protein [Desulfoplanes formicivorans]GAU09702.1 hypothetical protein DPF_2433 [Desulfoplanes formicivorans]
MSDLILWKNQELQKIKQDMDELLSCFMRDFSHPFPHDMRTGDPKLITFENKTSFFVKMDIPALCTRSLEVTIINHDLIIQGNQEISPAGPHGPTTQSFSFRVSLPGHIQEQGIKAIYREGTLIITLPKKSMPKPRRIQVIIPS